MSVAKPGHSPARLLGRLLRPGGPDSSHRPAPRLAGCCRRPARSLSPSSWAVPPAPRRRADGPPRRGRGPGRRPLERPQQPGRQGAEPRHPRVRADLRHRHRGGARGTAAPRFAWLWPLVRRNRAFPAFGAPLFAVADATVVRATDSQRDHLSRNSMPALIWFFMEGVVRMLGGARRILVMAAGGAGAGAVFAAEVNPGAGPAGAGGGTAATAGN